ncbi:Gfo/Idh/MocA family protein [Vibrio lentus]
MRLAIIGYGSHVKKNILPVLEKINIKPKIIVVNTIPQDENYNFTNEIDVVLNDKNIDTIYIATPIVTHYELSKKSLIANKNVICEKPICICPDELSDLVNTAKNNKVFIKQVEMYKYHKAYSYIKNLIESKEYGELISFDFSFKVPHLADNNIRYRKNLVGGALTDIGFYPISAICNLFPGVMLKSFVKTTQPNYDVDLDGLALFEYKKIFGTARWGLGVSYSNYLELEFSNGRIRVDRFFSKPCDYNVELEFTHLNGKSESREIGPDDQFKNMFVSYLSGVEITHLDLSTFDTIKVINTIYSAPSI